MQVQRIIAVAAGAAALLLPAPAFAGHGLEAMLLDHPAQSFSQAAPLSSTVNSGGPGAKWELVGTIPMGNPLSDIDFFTQGGNTYASAGTFAIGPNEGGQSIIQLTSGGTVKPAYVAGHPSATCISDPVQATGLQHDVEATPKGGAILNTDVPTAVRSDTQLLIDATDNPGRCHDQGVGGIVNAPQGGLEIIDVTTPGAPKEIGLTSHIGEAHTVNIDPKRPHIAYAVTSDSVSLNPDRSRQNEDPTDANDRLDLDGFEVVDLSSCMNFPAGTTIDQKRVACRPQVYRYRYPSADIALGHTLQDHVFGCHELEIYPDDRLTCGSGNALIVLDMSGAFNDMGTPTDFSDDKPRGTPLPCKVRPSSTPMPIAPQAPSFFTGAKVTDCVDGQNDAGGPGPLSANQDLAVPGWLAQGAPSLEGVGYVGSIHHQGRGAGNAVQPTFDSTQDIDFNHEAELSASGELLIATDERGGGIAPPGATCIPSGVPGVDNKAGNGGVHFYRTDGLHTGAPLSAQEEHQAYAKTPDGKKAIFRAQIRTKPQATVCTAHVFQQVPGQNRIFMGWYSQGTQVFDFLERPDGTVELKQAGWFIPELANEWVSHVFRVEENKDGTFTYYGATGDFNLGEAGRNAMDVYKVTLPPAPTPLRRGGGGGGGGGAGGEGGGGGALPAPAAARCPNVIVGSKKRDRLAGTNFGDTIVAKAGNDRVKAGLGDDCASGGKGKDTVNGQKGNDLIAPGKNRDRALGGPGDDKIKARSGGRDRVRCGPGKGDVALVDRRDRVRGCEKVKRK